MATIKVPNPEWHEGAVGIDKWIRISMTRADMENYLGKDNQDEYTPVDDYNPATKKYVDDSKSQVIQQMNSSLLDKVDKEDGKGLSTNDYTTEEKNKLNNISNNLVSGISVSNSTSPDRVKITYSDTDTTTGDIVSKDLYLQGATGEFAGLMISSDKTKLDGVEDSANNYSLPAATDTNLGGIQTGYTQSGKNYPVKLDDGNKAYVNIPWSDTIYDVATQTENGLMSSTDKKKLDGVENGANNYTLPKASTTQLGGIQLGFTEQGKNYPLELDENGKAYVNIPWSNTTYSPATSTTFGTVKIGTQVPEANGTASAGSTTGGLAASVDHVHPLQTTISGNAGTATKLKTARTISLTGAVTGSTTFDGSSNKSITTTLSGFDASKITSGTISIDRLPKGALERLVVVASDTERYKLTENDVQLGDTVKVESTGLMYYVVDKDNLANGAGYSVYTAGSATSVPWSGVTDKPSTFTPSTHTHTKSQITDFPASLKNPNSLTISLNGTSQGAYDGSAAKSFNITAASVGAADKSHTHSYLPLSGGTLTGSLIVGDGTDRLVRLLTYDGSGFLQLGAQDKGTGVISSYNDGTLTNLDIKSVNTKLYGSLSPSTTNTFTLGTSSLKWNNVYSTTFTGSLSGNSSSASKVNNNLIMKIKSGTTEGTDLYTFNGSAGKTLDIVQGSNVTLTAAAGKLTISATNTTYGLASSSSNGLMSASDKTKLDGISAGANNYTHPTSSGNKHIPSGGSSGQILRWSADGTAVWGADNNTTYGIATNSTNGLIKPWYNHTAASTGPTAGSNSTAVAVNAITTTSGRYYALEMDNAGRGFVNVPWSNTTYSNFKAATSSAAGGSGLVPAPAAGKQASFLRGDGTWVVPTNTNTTYTFASGTGSFTVTPSGGSAQTVSIGKPSTAGTADKATTLVTARSIDGVSFNGSANIIHYGTCSTAAATVEKAVSLASFTLVTGARVIVKFTVNNTASNPTLNVNSTGAKAIYYRGSAISAGQLGANRLYEFVYDGTNYEFIGDFNTNTTYSVATTSNNGLMSASDKSKLDGIATGANKYTLPTATSSVLGGVKTGTGITNSSGTISVTYGTAASTACQGNDSRLSNTRNPIDNNINNVDLNTLNTKPGFYYNSGGMTSANRPAEVDHMGMLVIHSAAGHWTQLAFSEGKMYTRIYNGQWSAWRANYDELNPQTTISGNAGTATTLATARTINGTSFNGSANITTANWGTARNIGIVNSDGTGTAVTVSVNGSGNVNLKLPSTIKAALTGNATTATTATKLGTATVGSTSKPIYLNAGTATALSATVGSATVPVYMNAGTVTQCTASSVFSNLSNSGNNISITVAGQNRTLTPAHAAKAGYVERDRGNNTVTTLASLPTSKRLILANLSAATTISVASGMNIGDEIYVVCTPSAAFTQPIPNSGSFRSMSGTSLSVTSGVHFEISILCIATSGVMYSISIKEKD